MSFKTIDPKDISNPALHHILLGAVSPRPIAFASTIDKDGNPNLSPFSFFNAFGVNPSTLIFSPSRRGRDNTVKHTYENVKEIPEVVINIVSYDIVQQMSLSSTEYDKGINEFEKSGLTAIASEKIRPFRVKESPVQFECKVREVIETNDEGGAANLVICEVLMVHINSEILDEDGKIDPNKAKLVGRMGGNYYVKAFGESLFEVEKPLSTKGIGIDSLPIEIRLSTILTGNDLGQLGNQETIPDADEISNLNLKKFNSIGEKQSYAQDLIKKGKVREAFCVLLTNSNN